MGELDTVPVDKRCLDGSVLILEDILDNDGVKLALYNLWQQLQPCRQCFLVNIHFESQQRR